MDDKIAQQILETLEKILRVVSLQVAADKSLTERVVLLRAMGLDNKTIASVIGTTPETVKALASQAKSKKAKK